MKAKLIRVHGQPYIAGLSWTFIPRTRTRSLRVLARSENASHFVAPLSADGQRLGCINLREMKVPGQAVSLALALLPALRKKSQSGLAIFDCGDGLFWFVALDGGDISVLSDIWGSADRVRAAVAEHLRFCTAAPTFCVAPDGFLPDQTSTSDALDALLPPVSPVQRLVAHRTIGLRPVSTQKSTARTALLIAALAGGWLGWQHWQAVQQAQRDQQAHAAFLARQAKTTHPVVAPWNALPSPADVVTQCSQRWRRLPLSIAGWTFSQTECGRDNHGHLSLATRYKRHDSVAVGDFQARLPVFYAVKPAFDIPGAAGTALFVLPVQQSPARRPEKLMASESLLTDLTSWSQQLNAGLTVRKATLNTKIPLPYTLWHYTLKTDIPPEHLFTRPFPGLSVSKITVSMSQQDARLHYVLEGELYAR